MIKKIILLILLVSGIARSETADDYYKKGLEFANNDKYDEAIAEIKKALDLNPKYAKCHLNLGVLYANKKDYDEAIKEVELSIGIEEDNIIAHYVLAMLYEKKKNNDKAIAEWGKVLKLNPLEEMKKFTEKHINRLKGK